MKYCCHILLGMSLLMGSALVQAEAAISAQETINQGILRMLEELKANEETLSTDPEAAAALIDRETNDSFDFDLVARLAMGKHWRAATPEQQEVFTREFRTMLVRFYGKALMQGLAARGVPSADRFTVLPGNDEPDAKFTTVRVRLTRSDGSLIALEYGMRRVGDLWKVYDVKVEGISVVMSYRNNLTREINAKGIDGLLAELIEKNRQNAESDLVQSEALPTRSQ